MASAVKNKKASKSGNNSGAGAGKGTGSGKGKTSGTYGTRTTAGGKKGKAGASSAGRRSSSARNKFKGTRTEKEKKQQKEIAVLFGIFLLVVLFISNFGILGTIGDRISGVEKGFFGTAAWIFPIMVFYTALCVNSEKYLYGRLKKAVSGLLLLFTICALLHLMFRGDSSLSAAENAAYGRAGGLCGGAIGGFTANTLTPLLGRVGTYLLLIVLVIALLVVLTEKSFLNAARTGVEKTAGIAKSGHDRYMELHRENQIRRQMKKEKEQLLLDTIRSGKNEDLVSESDTGKNTIPFTGTESGTSAGVLKNQDSPNSAATLTGDAEKATEGTGKTAGFLKKEAATPTAEASEKRCNQETSEKQQNLKTGSAAGNKTGKDGLPAAHSVPVDYDCDTVPFDEDVHETYRTREAYLGRESFGIQAASDSGYAVGRNAGCTDGSETEAGFPGLTEDHVSEAEFPGSSEGGTSQTVFPEPAEGNTFEAEFQGRKESNASETDFPCFREDIASESGPVKGGNQSADFKAATAPAVDERLLLLERKADFSARFVSLDEAGAGQPDTLHIAGGASGTIEGHNKNLFTIDDGVFTDQDRKNTDLNEALFESVSIEISGRKPAEQSAGPDNSAATSGRTANSGRAATSGRTANSGRAVTAGQAAALSGQGSSISGTARAGRAPSVIKAAKKPYVFPPVSLLKKTMNPDRDDRQAAWANAKKLEQTLRTFGVGVRVTNVVKGPSVTRYELTPEVGVKVAQIKALEGDIKLGLAAADIRIEAPIPGKSAVGIEVPNGEKTSVYFRDILESDKLKKSSSVLSVVIGKDIQGEPVTGNLAKMPHLLLSGTTGSGKSVGINSIIMSLLYRAKPEDVRMILIDPKVVELSGYNGIPHLLIPVVTKPDKALSALNWACGEMNDRYRRFSETNTRNIEGYNEKIERGTRDGQDAEKMPYIVIIIDELAELMMHSKKEVENAIVSLTQLARAAGIHLVVATQRPSVDVITGLIKSNIPSRIAYKLPSAVDSRTILDTGGAETLLGSGDMLYKPNGENSPARVQGAYLSDGEIENVVEYIRRMNPQEIQDSEKEELKILLPEPVAESSAEDGRDDLFADAGRAIIEKNKATIGMLQRLYKIGFNRAARIMDQLCEAGVVGTEEGTKPRRVLMNMEEFEAWLTDHRKG